MFKDWRTRNAVYVASTMAIIPFHTTAIWPSGRSIGSPITDVHLQETCSSCQRVNKRQLQETYRLGTIPLALQVAAAKDFFLQAMEHMVRGTQKCFWRLTQQLDQLHWHFLTP